MPFCKLTFQAKKPDFRPYPNELKTIGDHLRKKRLDLKMLQKEVAERFGTTICTIRNWEKNRSNPSLMFIPKIVQFFGYAPYDISKLDFGKEITTKRRLMGLRQKDVAQLLGVDPSSIKHWENNQSRPSKKLMQRVSALLISSDLRVSAKHR